MLNISNFVLPKRQKTFDDLSVGDIFIFEEGVYGICAISALCAPSSFYTAKIQNN